MFKSEELLVNAFVNHLEIENQSLNSWILREVDCWQGRADVVEVKSHETAIHITDNQRKLLKQLTCANIISVLHYGSPRTKEFLYNHLGTKSIDKWLKELLFEDVIAEVSHDKFVISSNFKLPHFDLCAYEIKLYDWRRALYQAIQYKGFSNLSYVVMPKRSVGPAIKNIEAFAANNIGLIHVDDEGECKVVLKSIKSKPRRKAFNIIGTGIALETLNSKLMHRV